MEHILSLIVGAMAASSLAILPVAIYLTREVKRLAADLEAERSRAAALRVEANALRAAAHASRERAAHFELALRDARLSKWSNA